MTDESELRARGGEWTAQDGHAPRANLRPTQGQPGVDGGADRSHFKSPQVTSPDFLSANPFVKDLLLVLIGGAVGFAAAIAWTKDGVQTGRRGFELSLENRNANITTRSDFTAALANMRAEFNKLLVDAVAASSKSNRNLSISLGRIMDNHVERITAAQANTDRLLAVLTEAQERSEARSKERLNRLETEVRDWQIRERTK